MTIIKDADVIRQERDRCQPLVSMCANEATSANGHGLSSPKTNNGCTEDTGSVMPPRRFESENLIASSGLSDQSNVSIQRNSSAPPDSGPRPTNTSRESIDCAQVAATTIDINAFDDDVNMSSAPGRTSGHIAIARVALEPACPPVLPYANDLPIFKSWLDPRTMPPSPRPVASILQPVFGVGVCLHICSI
ncbi:hypothetical protein CRI94_03375 [Longibacter salinarum]|uniref:Uncharacterized protein n=1 Tax=Longibacter salinarum TaxID=1850348 RepID=A0A2A8D2Z9_9BACT|nr:hypothetical protein CRI94_03375 [Longibacter salinarum]